MKKIKLSKLLQAQGFGARRACEVMILDGRVRVSGELATDPGALVLAEALPVEVDGAPWTCRAHLYVALNKPPNYECSRKPSHHRGVLSLFPSMFSLRNIQPVGRLDHDTTGMLLLSDDGQFIHRQASPKHYVPKTYEATTLDPVTPDLIASLLAGVLLHDEPKPIAAAACRQLGPRRLEIVLEQGKYHQVKRMLAAVDNRCEALTRPAIGKLWLKDLGLAEGEWRFLTDAQLRFLAPDARKE